MILNFLLYALVGVAAAVAGVVFVEGVAFSLRILAEESSGIAAVVAPPLAGILCAFLASRYTRSSFSNLSDIIAIAQRRLQENEGKRGALSILAAFIAAASGVSVGQYGPIAHLGGLLGATVRRLSPSISAACGVAAAIAAAFNAPFTGLLFAHEVILRHYSPRAFTAVAICAVVGHSVSAALFSRPVFLQMDSAFALQPSAVPLFLLFGLVFGVFAVYYLKSLFWLSSRTAALSIFWRLPIAGLVTGLLILWMRTLGDNKSLMQAAVSGSLDGAQLAQLFAAKTFATVICLGVGFAGGIVSPTLAIGGLAGLLWHEWAELLPAGLSAPPAVLALCGMIALTAPVIGAPIAGILFVMELSANYSIAIAAAVAIAVSVRLFSRLGEGSYYDRQLRRQNIDMRLTQEEWTLRTVSINALTHPPPLVVTEKCSLQEAVDRAIAGQTTDIHLTTSDNQFLGSLRLPQALSILNTTGNIPLSETPGRRLFSLSTEMSIADAMKATADFVGDNLPVVDTDGRLAGVINEGDMLREYRRLVEASHQQRTES